MHELVGERLPTISKDLYAILRGSYDFIGLNYYSTDYVKDAPFLLNSSNRGYYEDSLATTTGIRDGIPIGPRMVPIIDLYAVPYGIRMSINYVRMRYRNPPMFITENGLGEPRKDTLSLPEMLNDTLRVAYVQSSLKHMTKAIREGADVRGYFLWSLLDNFEWAYGYTSMFGICYVNFEDSNQNRLRRYPKLSALWYQKFVKGDISISRKEASAFHELQMAIKIPSFAGMKATRAEQL
eukprot:Gb_01986 [translate_table: standard]